MDFYDWEKALKSRESDFQKCMLGYFISYSSCESKVLYDEDVVISLYVSFQMYPSFESSPTAFVFAHVDSKNIIPWIFYVRVTPSF